MIEENPEVALSELEALTKEYNVEYLLNARIWPRLRKKEFNLIPKIFKDAGNIYKPYELVWQENHLTYKV